MYIEDEGLKEKKYKEANQTPDLTRRKTRMEKSIS